MSVCHTRRKIAEGIRREHYRAKVCCVVLFYLHVVGRGIDGDVCTDVLAGLRQLRGVVVPAVVWLVHAVVGLCAEAEPHVGHGEVVALDGNRLQERREGKEGGRGRERKGWIG